jgi:anaerobic magnesium-protoporphyrin IX monomethyl ester cyclase
MRVLFVFPDLSSTTTHYTGVLSYGLASLAAVLRQEGHEVALLHLTEPPTEAAFRERVRAACPDLVAFSSNSHYASRLRAWTSWAHEAARAPVVVGGVHATLAPADVAALPDVHFTCVGEGEAPLADLCRALESGSDPTRIPNLWARSGDAVVRNPGRPLLQDLDQLPDPDLSIFDVGRLYWVRQGVFTFLMSRGCAYGCTYCCAHGLRRAASGAGRYWRFLSPRRAVSQLSDLLRRHMPQAELVTFVDGILFPDRAWLEEFASLYRERIGLPFSCNLRADRVDAECAALLSDAGCRIARMGVESGDPRITAEVLQRGLEVADLCRAFALLRAAGIERWSYNMFGLPTETLRAALRTVRLNAEIEPDLALAFLFYPYPGTELRRRCAESGWLTGREYDHYQVNVTVRVPGFPEPDILFMHRFFRPLVRLYSLGRRLPGRGAGAWAAVLDATLASPLMPRAAIMRVWEVHRRLRHGAGEFLVRRSPALYRLLGGRAPATRAVERPGTAAA